MYAQYVKNTMEPLNIPNVCQDKRFPWTVSNANLDLEAGGVGLDPTFCGNRATCSIGFSGHLLLPLGSPEHPLLRPTKQWGM